MLPGRPYWIKIGTTTVTAQFERRSTPSISAPWTTWQQRHWGSTRSGVASSPPTGRSFSSRMPKATTSVASIVVDKMTNATVAAGMIHFALRRAKNVAWRALDIDRSHHARMKHQAPAVVWPADRSGSGRVRGRQRAGGAVGADEQHTFLLDGDNIRHGLSRISASTTPTVSRMRGTWRRLPRLMTDAGLIVIVSPISPSPPRRRMARDLIADGRLVGSSSTCRSKRRRSATPGASYARARAGELTHFTGVNSPYERPPPPRSASTRSPPARRTLRSRIIARLIP